VPLLWPAKHSPALQQQSISECRLILGAVSGWFSYILGVQELSGTLASRGWPGTAAEHRRALSCIWLGVTSFPF